MKLTPKAYEAKQQELDELYQKRNEVRMEKALVFSQGVNRFGDDNFGFEPVENMERVIQSQINDLLYILHNAEIIESSDEQNIVNVGSVVKLQVRYGQGNFNVMELRLEAIPTLEDDTVTLNSPIGQEIFGKSVGYEGCCKVGSDLIEVTLRILAIL